MCKSHIGDPWSGPGPSAAAALALFSSRRDADPRRSAYVSARPSAGRRRRRRLISRASRNPHATFDPRSSATSSTFCLLLLRLSVAYATLEEVRFVPRRPRAGPRPTARAGIQSTTRSASRYGGDAPHATHVVRCRRGRVACGVWRITPKPLPPTRDPRPTRPEGAVVRRGARNMAGGSHRRFTPARLDRISLPNARVDRGYTSAFRCASSSCPKRSSPKLASTCARAAAPRPSSMHDACS